MSGPSAATMTGLGQHVLIDYFDCESLPDDPAVLQAQLETAAKLIGATVVQSVFHQFNPYGLSGVVVVAESHLAVHTWPEHRVACVDFFTCSDDMTPERGIAYLAEAFAAVRYEHRDLARATLPTSATSLAPTLPLPTPHSPTS